MVKPFASHTMNCNVFFLIVKWSNVIRSSYSNMTRKKASAAISFRCFADSRYAMAARIRILCFNIGYVFFLSFPDLIIFTFKNSFPN